MKTGMDGIWIIILILYHYLSNTEMCLFDIELCRAKNWLADT